jgi:uncharacterized protein
MRIELASLEGTDGRFAHTYEPGQLSISDERVRMSEPLTVTGRIRQSQRKVEVEGQFSTTAQVECDRCLKPLAVPVSSEFKLEYVTPETYSATPAAALEEGDLSLSVFDGEGLDIDEIVGEQVLLALPSRILCTEDCKGLCPECGVDRNLNSCKCESAEIDPRWGALKELVNGK